MATTNDLKNGMVLNIDNQLWAVVEFQHVKPGKGPAFVRTKIKNVLSGKIVDKTVNAGVKVETAYVDRRDMTYLYQDGEDYVFMDSSTYDTLPFQEAFIEDSKDLLIDGLTVEVLFVDGKPVTIELPSNIELEVTESAPGVKGDTATAATKEAVLQTGLRVQVPLFINPGDRIKVSSEDKKYVSRA